MAIKEKICNEIRNQIISERFYPGERIIETELSKQFNVSRGPIREALAQLSKEGFVELSPNKGAIVAKLSIEDLQDFYTLLALLERQAVEWATPHLDLKDIDELLAINESLKECMTSDTEERLRNWGEQNLNFHRFFWERCGNTKMGWLIEEIRQRIFRYRYTSLIVTTFEDYLLDHKHIIEAVRRGDAVQAGKVMHDHIMRALAVLMEFFSKFPKR